MTTTTRIIEGQKYVCIGCGRCCQNWDVHVSPEEEKELNSKDWTKYSPRFSDGEKPAENCILKRKGERCIFLEDDLKCLIHSVISYQAKPLTCKQYPVWVTETPTGKRVSASFFCPAVVRNLGVPLKESPEMADGALEKFRANVVTSPVAVLSDTSMEWGEFEKLETELLGIPDREDLTVSQMLAAMYFRGHEVARAKMNKREVRPFDDCIVEAKKPFAVSEGMKSRFLRAIFIAFIEEATQEKGRQSGSSFAFYFVWQTLKMAMEWGSFKVSALNGEAVLSEVDRKKFDLATPTMGEVGRFRPDGEVFKDPKPLHVAMLRRYLKTIIFRAQVLTQQGLFRGISTFLLGYSLVIWYSRFSATMAKREEVAEIDLESGLAVVEKFFIQHTRGVQDLISRGMFSLLFEALMARSAVAISLINLGG